MQATFQSACLVKRSDNAVSKFNGKSSRTESFKANFTHEKKKYTSSITPRTQVKMPHKLQLYIGEKKKEQLAGEDPSRFNSRKNQTLTNN